MIGVYAGLCHAAYWILSLYIHKEEVLKPEKFGRHEVLHFNRLMMMRLVHFGLLGFCGILVSLSSFIVRK